MNDSYKTQVMFWSTAVCRPVRDIEVLRDLQVGVIIIIIEIITVIFNLIIIAIACVLALLILFSLPSPIITSSAITFITITIAHQL